MKNMKLTSFYRASMILMLLFVLLGGAATPAHAVGTTTTLDGQASCEAFGGTWTDQAPYGECDIDWTSNAAGDTLIISGVNLITAGFDNAGTIIIDQGFIFNNGNFTNDGTININQDAIVNNGTLTNNGTINIGELVDVYSPVGIGNFGTITNNGAISIDCGGDITDFGGSYSGNAALDVCGGLTDESSCQDLGGTWTLGTDFDVCQVSSLTVAVDDVFMIFGVNKNGVELKITGNLTNNGTIIIQRGIISNEGTFNNSGTIDIFEYAINNFGTLNNEGTINILDNGNEISVNGITNDGGTITNNGTINTDCGRGFGENDGTFSGTPVVSVCDTDNDGVLDNADNCQFAANADQSNFDGDTQGDACDPDDDNDGVNDGQDAFPFDATRAVSCSPGYFGAFTCASAQPGEYVGSSGALQPSLCPVGTFSDSAAAVACQPAAPGTFVDTVGATSSTACPVGYFQPNAGATSCFAAAPGYFVDTIGATAQSMCAVGYTSEAGATECYLSNNPPTANAGGSYSGNEGSAIAMSSASASDPDVGDTLFYAWTVYPASCSFNDASALNPTLTCTDNGSYTATLEVSDGTKTVSSTASVTVNNVAPTLGAISVNATLVPVNTAINASANFTDPGTLDTHTATWDWGDGTSAGTVTQGAGSGSVNGSHKYSVPGVYTVKLTVADNDSAVSNESVYEFVVVYDPNAGFVTGGGWIDSPVNANYQYMQTGGKATFGFVAKYKKGANVPDGNTQFQFKAGDLNFQSSSYEWLVVAGNRAQFKGVGTINGAGSYKFLITAIDGSPDTFRIKIWYEDNGAEVVMYDNGSQQSLGGGSIVVHK